MKIQRFEGGGMGYEIKEERFRVIGKGGELRTYKVALFWFFEEKDWREIIVKTLDATCAEQWRV